MRNPVIALSLTAFFITAETTLRSEGAAHGTPFRRSGLLEPKNGAA
jgi:hypothetical protein